MKSRPHRNTRSSPRRWINSLLVLFFVSIFHSQVHGQQIRLDADQHPLNQVLISLVEAHGVQISFNDRELSRYPVTVHREFSSTEEAIVYLLKPLPLDYEIIDGVYIIFSREDVPERTEYRVSGRVTDRLSGESLPFSNLTINGFGKTTDFSGHFSASASGTSTFDISISHLGYYRLDTTLRSGRDHVIGLMPSVYELEEIKVSGSTVERSGQVGEHAGEVRLNHKIADRLPGNGDDAVFNFLRLQPGIMAAGEQSSEMIIWGGYTGSSQLVFDGITIFGPRNFNDNISFVNPFMTKEIRVLKGGYPAAYGERVGGIVEVMGIEGNKTKPGLNLNINNMTVSGMVSLPVRKKAAITAAFRHTYYNVYDLTRLSFISDLRVATAVSGVDVTVTPDYRFRDANLKFSGAAGNGDRYYISLYSGGDLFSYDAEEETDRVRILQENIEKIRQTGGTAFYGKSWSNGTLSNFSLSYSGMNRELFERQEIFRIDRNLRISLDETRYNSSVSEIKFSNTNHFSPWKKHTFQAGAGYVYNKNVFLQNFEDVIYPEGFDHAGRFNLFLQDEYRPARFLEIKPGIRIDHPLQQPELFIQPRLQVSLDIGKHLKVNGAWGLYNQFIAKTSLLDELGNFRYFWVISDSRTVPVLKAQHLVGGIVYHNSGFTLSIEPFHKTVRGITRSLETGSEDRELYRGRARMHGADVMVKQYFGKHEAWVSYTLGKTEEHFPYFSSERYEEAPQDQRHEVKGALLLDFSPFYFSANYVYGSGLAYGSSLAGDPGERYPYRRLDASVIYRLKLNAFRIETGLSVLNIFNRENIKYSNLFEVPDGQLSSISIYAEAVPFTPTLYVNLAF